jgi:hypothetical protein
MRPRHGAQVVQLKISVAQSVDKNFFACSLGFFIWAAWEKTSTSRGPNTSSGSSQECSGRASNLRESVAAQIWFVDTQQLFAF